MVSRRHGSPEVASTVSPRPPPFPTIELPEDLRLVAVAGFSRTSPVVHVHDRPVAISPVGVDIVVSRLLNTGLGFDLWSRGLKEMSVKAARKFGSTRILKDRTMGTGRQVDNRCGDGWRPQRVEVQYLAVMYASGHPAARWTFVDFEIRISRRDRLPLS
ncbi:hypothetical protein PQX77_019318, partial [Marasmius sp. AFHP31]